MRRIKLIVAYDGTEYSGWQIQPEAPTIEMYLDKAIHELTGESSIGIKNGLSTSRSGS